MSSGAAFLALLVTGFFIGLWLAYEGTRKFLLLQRIENTATSSVQSTAIGMVELYGQAYCPEKIESPISGERCAYWCVVGQYYRRGKHGRWVEIFRRYSSIPFFLQDKTGKILVDPEKATMAIPRDHLYSGSISGKNAWGAFTKLEPVALSFIDSLDEAGKKAFMNVAGEEIRIYEFYIAEGDMVYVLGDAMPNPGTSGPLSHHNLIVKKRDVMYVSDSSERKICGSIRNELNWNIGIGLLMSMSCAAILALIANQVLIRFGY